MHTKERAAANEIDNRTITVRVDWIFTTTPATMPQRGDTLIVRETTRNDDGSMTLRIVNEKDLRDIATELLKD